MLSDESSSDSETGRFKGHNKNKEERSNNSSQKRDIAFGRSTERSRRYDDRFKDLDRKADSRDKFDSRSRDRHARDRYSRYSPSRRRHSQDRSRNRRSPESRRERHERDFRRRSKPRDLRSNSADRIRCSSRDKHRRSRSRSHKSPTRTRNVKEDFKDELLVKDRNSEKINKKPTKENSSSPETVSQKSAVHKPISVSQIKTSNSPILIEEQASDVSDEVQPGSYYSMIPAIVKDKSEESSEIDSSDDERLRAKLLNLEKELQKTKKKKHKKKHKRKSLKSDKEKNDSSASVEVSSTTDIQEVKPKELIKVVETAEVTSTQKSNQKESSEEGEILSDDSQSEIEIDPNDLRHKLKRSKIENTDRSQNLDVCGPALPPHLQKSSRKSSSSTEGPTLPPHLQKSRNIGPSIPEDLRQVLAERSEVIEVIKSSDEEDGIGPLPAGTEEKWSDAHQRLEERAMEMKIKSLDGHSLQNAIKSREQWMLELPEGKAKILGLEARSFRAKEGPDMSDRSSWTDTPEDKAKKALGIQKEEDSSTTLQREARSRYITNRDEEQEKVVKKHKKKHKREESLLDIHQKKLKKKKKKEEKDDEKKERRPFSRDLDLQVNRFDEAQKKSIIKKAQGLNNRFSSGEAKFL